jgi:hypothetical protein
LIDTLAIGMPSLGDSGMAADPAAAAPPYSHHPQDGGSRSRSRGPAAPFRNSTLRLLM